MALTTPAISEFAADSVMGVVRNVVDKIIEIVPDINENDITGASMNYSGSTLTLTLTKGDSTIITATATIDASGEETEINITQTSTAISINGTTIQTASASQIGLMSAAKFTEVTTATDNITALTALIGTDSDLITK